MGYFKQLHIDCNDEAGCMVDKPDECYALTKNGANFLPSQKPFGKIEKTSDSNSTIRNQKSSTI